MVIVILCHSVSGIVHSEVVCVAVHCRKIPHPG